VENSVALSRCTQRLRNLGLGKTEIEALTAEKGTSGLLPLTAPFAATVVERSAALGETVTQATALFAIADTKRMWAILDVHASDITKIAVGQPLVLDMEGLEDERHGGYITWVSSHLDRRTRTLKARAEILNSEGLLRDGMFGKAIVTIHDRENVLVVPKEAVQWEGCCNVVFVRRSDVLYEPRKVSLGYEGKDFLAVANGLTEGDVVVTTGSFLLKTEILRGSIGAGCCEPNPGAQ
jgi:cobalt-zinc-cadmium efflux system membrane fusion protein